jgi:predicted transcriptional regulator
MTYTLPHMAYGMLPSMEKTTVYLDPEVVRGLRGMSRSTGRPQAELIREALGAYLAATPRTELPGWVGSWKNGPVTDAADVRRDGAGE